MKLKNLLWIIEILAVVFWVIFLMILFFIDPYKSEGNVFILFFISMVLALAGTWSVIEFRVKIKMYGMDEMNKKILSSFRHGAMISIVISGLLFMKSIGVLELWGGAMFVLAILLFEAYFITRQSVITS